MIVNGQEVKVIQEYENFIVVEFPAGYRECISRFDLGQIEAVEVEKIHGNTGKRF